MAENNDVRIVQMSDESRTLPDGSKIVYAESDSRIVLRHEKQSDTITYVFDRKGGKVTINGQEGTDEDKRNMLALGQYMLTHCNENDMITISVQKR